MKKTRIMIAILLLGMPIIFQISGVKALRTAVSVLAVQSGPNLYVQKDGVQKPVPKFSTINLADGREGHYLWIARNEVCLELPGGDQVAVSTDQISRVVMHDFHVPMTIVSAAIAVGWLAIEASATSRNEPIDENLVEIVFNPDTEKYEELPVSLGGYRRIRTFYPGRAAAIGVAGGLAVGYLVRALKNRSTFAIGANAWDAIILEVY
ncbi:hypothetical protein ACFL4K_00995 [Candidatus Neomarinimicrobiota bacterium]